MMNSTANQPLRQEAKDHTQEDTKYAANVASPIVEAAHDKANEEEKDVKVLVQVGTPAKALSSESSAGVICGEVTLNTDVNQDMFNSEALQVAKRKVESKEFHRKDVIDEEPELNEEQKAVAKAEHLRNLAASRKSV